MRGLVLVEPRRPPTARSALEAVADPVGRYRDGGFDCASAQVGAVAAGVVRLVCPDPVRALARPAEPQPRHPDGFQDRFELRRVAPLPSRDHDGQGILPLPDCEVDLAGQSAAGASEAVVGRLDEDPAGWLLLEVPLFAAPAACRRARQTVEPTFTSQVIRPFASASAWSWVRILAQVPSRCQRRNGSWTWSHGP